MKLNITGKSSLSSFLEKLCWVFLLAGLTITVALPWILDYYGRIFWHGRLGTDYVRILFVLYPCLLYTSHTVLLCRHGPVQNGLDGFLPIRGAKYR